MKKDKLILNEQQVEKLVAKCVRRALKESSVAVRGTTTNTDVYPVPYDDDYVDRYGPTNPTDSNKSENDSIEKYGEAIAQRIDNIFKKKGIKGHVQVSEDMHNYDYQYGKQESKNFRDLNFNIDVRSQGKEGNVTTLMAATLVAKMLKTMSMVKSFETKVEVSANGSGHINVSARVNPDKNGMTQLQKEPSYYSDSHTMRSASSTYRPDREEDY